MKLKNVIKITVLLFCMTFFISCNNYKNFDHYNDDYFKEFNNKKEFDISGKDIYDESDYLSTSSLFHNNIIYFDLDKYYIRSEFTPILDNYATYLRNNPSCKIKIEGHTDERGTAEYNIALGERRANSVKIYLQSKGVSNNQITIISYGKEKPAVLGHEEIAYKKNRRAIILYQ